MRSQLHGVEQWVGADTAQRLTAYSAHLRAIAAQSANRGAPAASTLEPPEEVGHRSRGSRGGWAPDRRGCPGSRGSRPQRRRSALVAPQWRWPMMVVSSRLGARRRRHVPATPNGCSAEHGTLKITYTSGLAMFFSGCGLLSPSPGRAQVHASSGQLRCPLAEKGSFPKVTLDPP